MIWDITLTQIEQNIYINFILTKETTDKKKRDILLAPSPFSSVFISNLSTCDKAKSRKLSPKHDREQI